MQSFDGGDGLIFDLTDGDETGANGISVEQDGAGTAIAGIAANFGAGETEMLAQDAGEPVGWGSGHGNLAIVYDQFESALDL
jgi:hypothetical protein